MLMELDYETVSALESALIVAEDSKMRDAKDWANIAESLGASEQRRAADNLAAFCGGQANSYRKAMDALQQAKKKGCTMAQLALAWILSRRPWIVPIPGTTKLSRLEENIGAANVEFEPQELDELNSKLDQIQIYGERYNAQQESLVER